MQRRLRERTKRHLHQTIMIQARMAVRTLIMYPCRFIPSFRELVIGPPIRAISGFLCLNNNLLRNFLIQRACFTTIPMFLFHCLECNVIRNICGRILTIMVTRKVNVMYRKQVSLRPGRMNVIRIRVRRIHARSR